MEEVEFCEKWINVVHPEYFRQKRIASVLHAKKHIVARTELLWASRLRKELEDRSIDERYLRFVDVHSGTIKFIAYAVESIDHLPEEIVESKVYSIVLWYVKSSMTSLSLAFDYMTRMTENARDMRDTKFSYYLKVSMTLGTLSRIRRDKRIPTQMLKASFVGRDSQFANYDGGFVRVLRLDTHRDDVAALMTRMRHALVHLVNNMRFENMNTGHAKGSDLWSLWKWSFHRCVTITTTKTVFLEKFIGTETRAYNVLKGESIVMTVRNVVRPLEGPLLDESGLLLLYLHELGHTLAPVYDRSQIVTLDGRKRIHVERDLDGGHGIKFQTAMQFLFKEARRLNMISLECNSYNECEMHIREAHQESSLEMPVSLQRIPVVPGIWREQ